MCFALIHSLICNILLLSSLKISKSKSKLKGSERAMPSESLKKLFAVLLALISIAYIIVQAIYGYQFLDTSVSLTISLQNSLASSEAFVLFMEIVSVMSGAQVVITGVILVAIDPIKIRSIKLVFLMVAVESILPYLMALYHYPRPYYLYPEVKAIGCDNIFGNPSGHGIFTSFIFPVFYWMYISKEYFPKGASYQQIPNTPDETDQAGETIPHDLNAVPDLHNLGVESQLLISIRESSYWRYIIMGFLILLGLTCGLSRIFLGLHTLAEVMCGWAYGTLFCVIFWYGLEGPFDNYLHSLCLKTFTSVKRQYVYRSVFLLIYIGLAVLVYEIMRRSDTIAAQEASWAAEINEKCPSSSSDSYQKTIVDKTFEYFSHPLFLEGVFLGLLLSNHYKKGYLYDNTSYLGYKKLVGRIIFYVLILLIPQILYYIPKPQTEVAGQYFTFFVKKCIPFYLEGLACAHIAPLLFKRLHLMPSIPEKESRLQNEIADQYE